MTKNFLKLSITFALIAVVIGLSPSATAFPPFLKKAAKFGAKNCQFCHKEPTGGEGWNERGNWLIAEKERRKADAVDPEWLSEYKEADSEKKEKEDDKDKKEGEKKEKP